MIQVQCSCFFSVLNRKMFLFFIFIDLNILNFLNIGTSAKTMQICLNSLWCWGIDNINTDGYFGIQNIRTILWNSLGDHHGISNLTFNTLTLIVFEFFSSAKHTNIYFLLLNIWVSTCSSFSFIFMSQSHGC